MSRSPSPDDDLRLRDALSRRLSEAVAIYLWRLGAVRVDLAEPFRLASGARSPIYVDCRLAISSPALLQVFCAAVRQRVEDERLKLDVVAGGETAGIPLAAVLATALGLPMVYVRKQPKGHGTGSRVEGRIPAGARVLLVEDLITDGGSKLGFLDGIAEAGGQVRDVAVLFDREQGGRELLAGRDVALHAVCGRATVLAVGRDVGLLDDAALAAVTEYFADPVAWQRDRGFDA